MGCTDNNLVSQQVMRDKDCKLGRTGGDLVVRQVQRGKRTVALNFWGIWGGSARAMTWLYGRFIAAR